MTYNKRIVDGVLDDVLSQLPAVFLDGPKAVGKTTTALQRAKTVKRLNEPQQRNLAEMDGTSVCTGDKPILIDEWQRVPQVWDTVKTAVDSDYRGGQFILTGSFPRAATHSGAGRITAIRMRPLSIAERGVETATVSLAKLLAGEGEVAGETRFQLADYCHELMQSGFPAMRGLSARALRLTLDGYLERIFDSDISEAGFSAQRPASVRAWLTAYAAATATTTSWESIRRAASIGFDQTPAKSTVLPYRDALTRLRILDELPAWSPTNNQIARISRPGKHFLADPALALRLLHLDAESVKTAPEPQAGLHNKPLLGRMFEALATQSIATYAEANYAKAMHFRDQEGRHEVDLIVEREDGRVLAIEVKLATIVKPNDARHLRWLKAKLGDQVIDSVVIYAGRYALRHEGIAYVPLALLGV